MSGIYIHIPFCKKKCSYCDFHFSTNLKQKSEMIEMLKKELIIRKSYLKTPVQTIYFGGGTPSLLSKEEIMSFFEVMEQYYDLSNLGEVTLEANPDDLTYEKLLELKQTPVNRLSIGVQSFFDSDLQLMNRIHTAKESEECIKNAQKAGFENLSIDLIYGSTTTTDEMWKHNVQKAVNLNVPHISSYALTIEGKTLLESKVRRGLLPNLDEEKQNKQFHILCATLKENGFIQYEISNFAKENHFAVHNANYWKGIAYLGIGPSAHSFDLNKRSWNIANNSIYIKSLKRGELPQEEELLSSQERYNELIMIRLRTIWGVSEEEIKKRFSKDIYLHFKKEIEKLLKEDLVKREGEAFVLTEEAKFFADGIATRLFKV